MAHRYGPHGRRAARRSASTARSRFLHRRRSGRHHARARSRGRRGRRSEAHPRLRVQVPTDPRQRRQTHREGYPRSATSETPAPTLPACCPSKFTSSRSARRRQDAKGGSDRGRASMASESWAGVLTSQTLVAHLCRSRSCRTCRKADVRSGRFLRRVTMPPAGKTGQELRDERSVNRTIEHMDSPARRPYGCAGEDLATHACRIDVCRARPRLDQPRTRVGRRYGCPLRKRASDTQRLRSGRA